MKWCKFFTNKWKLCRWNVTESCSRWSHNDEHIFDWVHLSYRKNVHSYLLKWIHIIWTIIFWVPDFAIGCPCSVWCCGLITQLLCISTLFESLDLNNSKSGIAENLFSLFSFCLWIYIYIHHTFLQNTNTNFICIIFTSQILLYFSQVPSFSKYLVLTLFIWKAREVGYWYKCN